MCDILDTDNCSICYYPLLAHLGDCISNCPMGTLSNFEATTCIALDSLDVRIVYFPVLMVIVILAAISWVGKCVKPKHNVLANYVVMMGMLEHLAILAQVALTFAYGTLIFAFLIILIWLIYLAIQLAFYFRFKN